MPIEIHDFQEKLVESQKIQKAEFWHFLYERFFGAGITFKLNEEDSYGQRLGIDRTVIVSGGKTYQIEEKIRFQSYDDILLEFVSNSKRNTPGWVCKPLMADFILYVNLPLSNAYWLPVAPLQRAWKIHGKSWIKRRTIPAYNHGYETLNTPVTVPEMNDAIIESLSLQPIEQKLFSIKNINHGGKKS